MMKKIYLAISTILAILFFTYIICLILHWNNRPIQALTLPRNTLVIPVSGLPRSFGFRNETIKRPNSDIFERKWFIQFIYFGEDDILEKVKQNLDSNYIMRVSNPANHTNWYSLDHKKYIWLSRRPNNSYEIIISELSDPIDPCDYFK